MIKKRSTKTKKDPLFYLFYEDLNFYDGVLLWFADKISDSVFNLSHSNKACHQTPVLFPNLRPFVPFPDNSNSVKAISTVFTPVGFSFPWAKNASSSLCCNNFNHRFHVLIA